MTDWITDRPPARVDGDKHGDVWVQQRPNSEVAFPLHWDHVSPQAPWRHTALWKKSHAASIAGATEPRRFTSITPVDGGVGFAAVADDGTAWCLDSKWTTWTQLPALPDREPESHSEN